MAEEDDLISKILKEDSISNVEVNPNEYDVNSIINPQDDSNNILNTILNENITDNLDIPEAKENKENAEEKKIEEKKDIIENEENIEKIETKETQSETKNENKENKEKESEKNNNNEENKPKTEQSPTLPPSENALKEPEKKEENIDNIIGFTGDNLDDEINKILNEKLDDIPSITTSEIQKEIEEEIKTKAQKEIENEIKDATKSFNLEDKDLEIKKDIEKMLQEEKNKKLKEEEKKKKKEAEQKMLKSFYPPFKNPLDFVQYLEVDKIYGQISNEMKNFSLNNQRKQDNKYDVSQIRSLVQINQTLQKFSVNFISAKNTVLIVATNDGQFLFFSLQPQKIDRKSVV